MIKRSILSLILLFLPLCSWAAVSLEVSPIRAEHAVQAGSSETNAILVRNGGDEPTRIKVTVLDFSITEDGAPLFRPPGDSPFSLSSFLTVNPVDFRLNPGQSRYVRYTLSIPEGTKEGGYFSAMSFETVPIVVPGKKVRKLLLKGRVMCILYESLGIPLPSGEMLDLKKEGKAAFLTLKNKGEVYFRTKGEITIEDERGKVAEKISLPDCPVLPGAIRRIKVNLKEDLPEGEYLIKAEVDIGGRERLVGEKRFSIQE